MIASDGDRSEERHSPDMIERILVIRTGALGDTILTLPLLSSLRVVHPGALLTYVGSRAYKDLIPRETAFYAIDDPKWLWLFAKGTEPPHEKPEPFDAAYVILNQPDVVTNNLRNAGTAVIRTVSSRPNEGAHLVEHVHRELGLPVPPRESCLRHLAPPGTKDLMWVHPGSGGQRKCLPLGLMISCVQRLREFTGWDVVVTAGEEDAFLKQHPEWETLVAGPGTVLLENRPLPELCAKLGSARIFLGNDSGIGHLAAGLGIFSVLFFVDTDPLQWAPWVPSGNLHIVDVRDGSAPLTLLDDFFNK